MQLSSIGAFAPVALLITAFMNWTLISLGFFLTFLIVQYKIEWQGVYPRAKPVVWKFVVMLVMVVMLAEGGILITWLVKGRHWKASSLWWFNLLGLSRFNPWHPSSYLFFSLISHVVVLITAASAWHHEQSYKVSSAFSIGEGSQLRVVLRGIVIPIVQLLAGLARPCWISLPFFICSCVGLLHWSLKKNYVRSKWGWSPLLLYTGLDALMIYLYQLPIAYPTIVSKAADYVGLFKIEHEHLGWPEAVQGVCLLAFYILLSISIHDAEENAQQGGISSRDLLPITFNGLTTAWPNRFPDDSCLSERLLDSPALGLERDKMSFSSSSVGQKHGVIFQLITINFFAYGFPICLLALALWSFKYASFCAFFLLLYVGYTLYAFPSVHSLRYLSTILLAFILIWAVSTYVFNSAFTFLREEVDKDNEVWDTIGLWHYSIPGFFLLAQYSLGALVGADIFVSNAVLDNTHVIEGSVSEDENIFEQEQHDTKVLVLAVALWCVRRSAHAISLVLIFQIGVRHGSVFAIYMVFFLIYLLSSNVAMKTRQYLILFCELHFGILYLLRLELISTLVEKHQTWLKPILSDLGLSNKAGAGDFLSITALLGFSAIQNHGFKLLLYISAVVQKSVYPPFGFGVLKAGISRSILLSICASHDFRSLQQGRTSTVNWITIRLSDIGETVRSTYRSFGTYIAFLTILLVVYVVGPNYISLGYLVLLLFWMTGRQFLGRTRTPLWFPLFMYAVTVFVFYYSLICFPELQKLVSKRLRLDSDVGFSPSASVLGNLWDSLVILAVMQLFRYERAQQFREGDHDEEGDHVDSNSGLMGLVKRFLILHSGKVLSITVFYASIAPVSALGFVYLLMLIWTSNRSKTSMFPARFYSFYTALYVVAEFLFQMVGEKLQVLPDQVHGPFAFWLGFQVFERNFWGMESGFRSKALVLASCLLQYSAFHWLERLPASLQNDGQLDEPCLLFLPYPPRRYGSNHSLSETEPLLERQRHHDFQAGINSNRSDPSSLFKTVHSGDLRQGHNAQNNNADRTDLGVLSNLWPSSNKQVGGADETALRLFLTSPSAKESRQWSKRAMLVLKRERYDAQLRTLRIYAKHLTENFFRLFGLEMTMVVLLVASFSVLNVISLLYIIVLSLCILLNRRVLRSLWPSFVVIFASVLVVEYVALGKGPPPWNIPHSVGQPHSHHSCLQCGQKDFKYCRSCWLGIVVDDHELIVAYFTVFLISCFKLRSNMFSSGMEDHLFRFRIFPLSDRIAWKEISYETKGQWTWLDHLKFFFYRHHLDVVLLLVLFTGTLQYDVLHLGYLTFALVFFRMRGTILKKRNSIFRFLRIYNFVLIVISLLYQAPYFGDSKRNSCTVRDYLSDIVGLVKLSHGFDITSRSALVDITIFCLVGLQSSIFHAKEFEQVSRYLEAEEVDVKLQAQERKAAWKTEELQRIREMEESKHQRHMQVDKMKREMLHLQLNLDVLNSQGNSRENELSILEPSDQVRDKKDSLCNTPSLDSKIDDGECFPLQSITMKEMEDFHEPYIHTQEKDEDMALGFRRRKSLQHHQSPPKDLGSLYLRMKSDVSKTELQKSSINSCVPEIHEQDDSPKANSLGFESLKSLERKKSNASYPKQSFRSSVQILGDGVAQVQNLGNKALANLVGFLNIDQNDSDDTEVSSTEEEGLRENAEYDFQKELFAAQIKQDSADSNAQKESFREMGRRLRMLWNYSWSKIRSNTDVVCYVFFVVVYIWNYSLLTLVYLSALFLYALLVNPGPGQQFWLGMLIYTELNILLQYVYQIADHCCGFGGPSPRLKSWLRWLGIPAALMTQSFVLSVLPLFLVYLTTLVQSSIKARDGEWMAFNEGRLFSSRRILNYESNTPKKSLKEKLQRFTIDIKEKLERVGRGILRYWKSLIHDSESPPHFVQVSMNVTKWPEDGIQPERIESGINKLLVAAHEAVCQNDCHLSDQSFSRIRVESIESNKDKTDVAVAVLEVIYAAPWKGCPASAHYSSLTPAEDVAWEIQRAKDEGLVDATMFPFPILSVIAGGKREVDLYAYIFGTDLIAFFLVALFYQSFIKNSPELLNVYQLDDQFPKEFVFILMTLFFLIVMDRVIYLCSFAIGKVLYYFCSLVLYTCYVTQNARSQMQASNYGTGLSLLRIFHLTKAFSLSLQALQIKYGIPHKSTLFGQFLMRKVANLNYIGFRLYRSLPFLFELRCILDWSCTATSLTMYDWLKLEDIYASLFLVQCDIKLARQKHQLGEKQGMWTKFFSGICLFLVLICIIWAPMLMYSSGNPTNIANPILDVQTQIDIKTKGGTFTLYKTSMCQIFSMDDLVAQGYDYDSDLQDYDIRDVQLICCEAEADSMWLVPPQTLKNLMDLMGENITVISRWEFSRQRPKTKELATCTSSDEIAGIRLQEALNGTMSAVEVPELYPRYFRVTGTGDARMLEGTSEKVSGNLTLTQGVPSWWSFFRHEASIQDGCGSLNGPIASAVSEEVPQGLIGDTLSKFSIASLYITFVLALGRFIRLQCADLRMRIPYENLPSCDRLVAICEDIYAARAAGELALEEGLYWTLVKLYRSPHVLLEYTKDD